MVTASTARLALGAGSAMGVSPEVRRPMSSDRRVQPCLADTKFRQWAIANSTGASARDTRIELAMMMPGVASWKIVR